MFDDKTSSIKCQARGGRSYTTPLLLLVSALMTAAGADARADEDGTSFWLPGQYASLAAVPPGLGWSLSTDAYFYNGKASVSEIFSIGETLFVKPDSREALLLLAVAYAPETKVLGGQQWYANLRGRYEFWAENRYEGYAVFATLSIPLSSVEK
jgi:hypothetical protein